MESNVYLTQKKKTMTNKELRDEAIHRLINNPGATIVKHISGKGKECWRIRDKDVNPVMNISNDVFEFMQNHNLIKQHSPREWIFLPDKWKEYQRTLKK